MPERAVSVHAGRLKPLVRALRVDDPLGLADYPTLQPREAEDEDRDRQDRVGSQERPCKRGEQHSDDGEEIARELHISVKTVETHVSAVLRKLQLSSRYQLTQWAAIADSPEPARAGETNVVS